MTNPNPKGHDSLLCLGGDVDQLFKHMDENEDGLISMTEFKMFFSRLVHAKGPASVELLVE